MGLLALDAYTIAHPQMVREGFTQQLKWANVFPDDARRIEVNTPDYATAVLCLRETLETLDGIKTPESFALWNMSSALLVICDGLQNLDAKLHNLETAQRQAK
jgi:hypothetical protein